MGSGQHKGRGQGDWEGVRAAGSGARGVGSKRAGGEGQSQRELGSVDVRCLWDRGEGGELGSVAGVGGSGARPWGGAGTMWDPGAVPRGAAPELRGTHSTQGVGLRAKRSNLSCILHLLK